MFEGRSVPRWFKLFLTRKAYHFEMFVQRRTRKNPGGREKGQRGVSLALAAGCRNPRADKKERKERKISAFSEGEREAGTNIPARTQRRPANDAWPGGRREPGGNLKL